MRCGDQRKTQVQNLKKIWRKYALISPKIKIFKIRQDGHYPGIYIHQTVRYHEKRISHLWDMTTNRFVTDSRTHARTDIGNSIIPHMGHDPLGNNNHYYYDSTFTTTTTTTTTTIINDYLFVFVLYCELSPKIFQKLMYFSNFI